jgi:hypothetical protein
MAILTGLGVRHCGQKLLAVGRRHATRKKDALPWRLTKLGPAT